MGTVVETRRAGMLAIPRLHLAGLVRGETVALALILLAALALRLAWIAYSDWQPTPDDDAYRYDFTARALIDGQGYAHLDGRPTAFWPPGYPLLLAGAYFFDEGVRVAQLLNAVLGTGTVLLVYLIGRRAFGAVAGLAGAAVTACFPSLIFFTAVTVSETAFMFFALLGVWLVQREEAHRRGLRVPLLLGAGLALGFASLIKGQALLLPLVFVPFWLRAGIGWRGVSDRLVALMLGVALFVAPWTVRNAIEIGSPVIATNAGVDFWIGHHDGADGRGQMADELVFSRPEMDPVDREVATHEQGLRDGLRYAATHPLDETRLAFQKLFWLYAHDEEGLRWNEGHGGQPFLGDRARDGLLALSNSYYLVVLVLFALGLPLWFSVRDPARVLLMSLVVYWTAVHLVFFGDPRFHAPIMPLVALLAALPWAVLWPGRISLRRIQRQPSLP